MRQTKSLLLPSDIMVVIQKKVDLPLANVGYVPGEFENT
jgi:hypothetical protein